MNTYEEELISLLEDQLFHNQTSQAQWDEYERIKKITNETQILQEINKLLPTDQANTIINHAKKKHHRKPTNITNLRVDDYIENVKHFSTLQPFFYDNKKIYWFWDEENKKYDIVDETDVLIRIENELGLYGSTVKNNIKNAYLEAFRQVGRKNTPRPAKNTWIQFKNKIYDIETGQTFPATPEYLFTNPIPHDLSERTETPYIDKLLASWVNPPQLPQLYEVASYCLLTHYPIHRIIALLGEGSNGKSCYLNFIQNLIGEHNYCTTELDQICDNRFEGAKLYRKLACIMGETNVSTMKKTSYLKKLSAGDPVSIEFKGKNPFDAKNYAKLLISSNSLPTTIDQTKGFHRRWLTIDFPNEFPEGRDPVLDIPPHEYENFCAKAIQTLQTLLKKYQFTNEGGIEERARRYEEKSNPLNKFFNEHVQEDFDGIIFKYEFRQQLEDFCKKNNHRPVSDVEISGFMRTHGIECRKKSPDWYDSEGELPRYMAWVGISFIKDGKVGQNVQPVPSVHPTSLYTSFTELRMKKGGKAGLGGQEVTYEEVIDDKTNLPCHLCGNKDIKNLRKYNKMGKPICQQCENQTKQNN